MDKQILKKLLLDYKNDLGEITQVYMEYNDGYRFKDLMFNCKKFLPDHTQYFTIILDHFASQWKKEASEVMGIIDYSLTLIDIELEVNEVKEGKILKNAEEKLKEAGISFNNQDYDGTMNNLNSATELALKDELDIPTTISQINTRKVIEICISENIGPIDYLKELIKHVLEVNNKNKHIGYSPSKVDCITAITAVENFLKKTKKYPFKISELAKTKIFSGI